MNAKERLPGVDTAHAPSSATTPRARQKVLAKAVIVKFERAGKNTAQTPDEREIVKPPRGEVSNLRKKRGTP
jgi:hypothetical protein